MEPSLAFNTIISFMTNTNLQHYSGESGLSYWSQMLVITFMMLSPPPWLRRLRGLHPGAGRENKGQRGATGSDLVR